MMYININIHDSSMVFKKLQDCQYKIVNIAESRCLWQTKRQHTSSRSGKLLLCVLALALDSFYLSKLWIMNDCTCPAAVQYGSSTYLGFLRMVQPSWPVDCNVTKPMVQLQSTFYCSSSIKLTEPWGVERCIKNQGKGFGNSHSLRGLGKNQSHTRRDFLLKC